MKSRLYSYLRQARLRRKRTLVSVSSGAGITFQQLSVIETGETDVRLSSIERVASQLGYELMLVPSEAVPTVRRMLGHPNVATKDSLTHEQ